MAFILHNMVGSLVYSDIYAIKAELLWHGQNCDLIWCLTLKEKEQLFSQDLNHKHINHI